MFYSIQMKLSVSTNASLVDWKYLGKKKVHKKFMKLTNNHQFHMNFNKNLQTLPFPKNILSKETTNILICLYALHMSDVKENYTVISSCVASLLLVIRHRRIQGEDLSYQKKTSQHNWM